MNASDMTSTPLCERILAHLRTYPSARITDVFKFIYQSTHGCEHLISSNDGIVERIREEYASLPAGTAPLTERLGGGYSRVHLGCLGEGLRAETLAWLFARSAKTEAGAAEALAAALDTLKDMASQGLLPFDHEQLAQEIRAWEREGFGAVRHSEQFRQDFHPAYRVIANEYARLLPLLCRLDRAMARGERLTIAIEGGSASGKTTLASLLAERYGCTVYHMDDFFLRPGQRTRERLAEVGGNVDRERFLAEVLLPHGKGESVTYRPFDCSVQALGEPVTVEPSRLTLIEGAYALHPTLAPYYDFSVFLDVDPETQKKRIQKRNTPPLAKRFFEEWIPMEMRYFDGMNVKERCDLVIKVDA